MIVSENFQKKFRISKRFWSCDVVHEKVCTKRVRHYSVRTRNQITSFAMTANSKNSEIIQNHHQLSSKLIFLYPRHNWSDLLFLFILIVFYYYVLLDVYPPRNFKIFYSYFSVQSQIIWMPSDFTPRFCTEVFSRSFLSKMSLLKLILSVLLNSREKW